MFVSSIDTIISNLDQRSTEFEKVSNDKNIFTINGSTTQGTFIKY